MASSSWLKTQRSGKVSERDTLVRRKNGVDTIIRKIGTDFDNDVTNINNMITYCSSYYSSGLKGRKKSISSDIDSEKENMIVMIRKLTLVKQIYKMNQIDVRQG